MVRGMDTRPLQMKEAECWSCGDAASTPNGLCSDCATINQSDVPDIHDPNWVGNVKPLEAIFVAPPNVKRVS